MQGFAGDLWTSFINANDDGTQSPGTFIAQVVAVDGKGAPDDFGAAIHRGRSGATRKGRVGASVSSLDFLAGNSEYFWGGCPSPVPLTFAITAVDPDTPNGPLDVQVSWSLSDSRRRPLAERHRARVPAEGDFVHGDDPDAGDRQLV